MKALRITSLLAALVVLGNSCYYDVEEELYTSLDCATDDMSYVNDILPIIEADCYTCHSAAANFGNITLEGHSEILKHIDEGRLLGSIKHEPGFSPMPKNDAQLLDCELEKIAAWVNDGALNN